MNARFLFLKLKMCPQMCPQIAQATHFTRACRGGHFGALQAVWFGFAPETTKPGTWPGLPAPTPKDCLVNFYHTTPLENNLAWRKIGVRNALVPRWSRWDPLLLRKTSAHHLTQAHQQPATSPKQSGAGHLGRHIGGACASGCRVLDCGHCGHCANRMGIGFACPQCVRSGWDKCGQISPG